MSFYGFRPGDGHLEKLGVEWEILQLLDFLFQFTCEYNYSWEGPDEFCSVVGCV